MLRGLPLVVALAAGCSKDADDSDKTSDPLPCVEVDPSTIEFGDVEVTIDAPATSRVTVRNACDGALELLGVELSDPTAPFELGAIGSILLEAGEVTDFEVTFDPQEAWDRTDVQLLIHTNDPERPTATVDLLGRGAVPEIEVDPLTYDFGDPYIGCASDVPITIRNVGTADLVVTDVQFATGTVDFDFRSDHVLPLTLPPEGSAAVVVDYLGLDEFEDQAYLTVESNDPYTPEVVADLYATATKYGDNLDVFEQPSAPQSDILLVIDNSDAMEEEQAALTSNLEAFLDALDAAGSDYQIAVITTDNPNPRGDIVTPLTPDPVVELIDQATVGTSGEQGIMPLEMPYQATSAAGDLGPGSSFLRDDARLVILAVTNAADVTSPMTPADYVDSWLALKGDDPDLLRYHAIAGDVPTPPCDAEAGTPLDEAVALTSGTFVSVCATDWEASLETIARDVVPELGAFVLTQVPVRETIEVTVDGISTTTGWEYDPSRNAIEFEPDAVPAPGVTVEVQYELLPDCDG